MLRYERARERERDRQTDMDRGREREGERETEPFGAERDGRSSYLVDDKCGKRGKLKITGPLKYG